MGEKGLWDRAVSWLDISFYRLQKMLKIAAFSKFLGYSVGGAELSLINYIKEMEKNNTVPISIIYCEGLKAFSASELAMNFPDRWEVLSFKPKVELRRFFFYDYLINKPTVEAFFSRLDADRLYAQGLWAPAAINSFKGDKVRFVRDEYDLNIWNNYYRGIKRLAKSVYQFSERPGYLAFCNDNTKAMEQTHTIIANSQYMAESVKTVFGRESIVQYPDIDVEKLKAEYSKVVNDVPPEKKAVVMVGNSVIKGIDLFCSIAGKFPDEQFMVFSRSAKIRSRYKNITFMPWQKNIADVYKSAKLVIVPSKCNEAFGRVPMEAKALGIPVIASDKGGLPEAVDYNSECIAVDYGDFLVKTRHHLN